MPMREYTYAPKNRSRRAYLYILGCVCASVILWTVPFLWATPYAVVWFFGACFILTCALLITTRYLIRRYVYRLVRADDGGFDFVVLEISGKRTTCVCRISTDDFRALTRESKKKRCKPDYDWSTALGEPAYLLTISEGESRFFDAGEELIVRFSPDREMAEMIEYSLHPII